jgi:hypothetical protein
VECKEGAADWLTLIGNPAFGRMRYHTLWTGAAAADKHDGSYESSSGRQRERVAT